MVCLCCPRRVRATPTPSCTTRAYRSIWPTSRSDQLWAPSPVEVTAQPCLKTSLARPPASACNETRKTWPISHLHPIKASSMRQMLVSSSMAMGLRGTLSPSMSPDSLKDFIRCHKCTIQSLQGQFKCFRKKRATLETVQLIIQMVASNQQIMPLVAQPMLSTSAKDFRTKCEARKANRKVKSNRMDPKVSGRRKTSC